MTDFATVHMELADANAFVHKHHRHHKPVVGHRFSIGCVDQLGLAGVAIVGRPVAFAIDYRTVIEVLRLCTDGTKNACSFLYAASARAGRSLGYRRVGTYILDTETGATLLAAGWVYGHQTRGRDWNSGKRTGRRTDQPMSDKQYWYRDL